MDQFHILDNRQRNAVITGVKDACDTIALLVEALHNNCGDIQRLEWQLEHQLIDVIGTLMVVLAEVENV